MTIATLSEDKPKKCMCNYKDVHLALSDGCQFKTSSCTFRLIAINLKL